MDCLTCEASNDCLLPAVQEVIKEVIRADQPRKIVKKKVVLFAEEPYECLYCRRTYLGRDFTDHWCRADPKALRTVADALFSRKAD